MPSLRARLVNSFLRRRVKPRWRSTVDVPVLRADLVRIDRRLSRNAPPVEIEPVDAGGVPANWYGAPSLSERGSILYLHGGAWCLHFPGTYRRLATRLSAMTGMRVLLPDYRLAPEHKFPAGIDDCLAAYHWLIERGCGGRPLAIAGDSAGGNLTLVTLMRARERALPMPDCAALLSPCTDFTMSGPSMEYNDVADPMLSSKAINHLPELYCPGITPAHPWLSPLFGDWRGLPPLLFHAGSTEILLDDSVRAHDRACAAGVDARIKVWRGLPHVAPVFTFMPEADVALREIADFVVRHAGRGEAIVRPTAAASGPAVATGLEFQRTTP